MNGYLEPTKKDLKFFLGILDDVDSETRDKILRNAFYELIKPKVLLGNVNQWNTLSFGTPVYSYKNFKKYVLKASKILSDSILVYAVVNYILLYHLKLEQLSLNGNFRKALASSSEQIKVAIDLKNGRFVDMKNFDFKKEDIQYLLGMQLENLEGMLEITEEEFENKDSKNLSDAKKHRFTYELFCENVVALLNNPAK